MNAPTVTATSTTTGRSRRGRLAAVAAAGVVAAVGALAASGTGAAQARLTPPVGTTIYPLTIADRFETVVVPAGATRSAYAACPAGQERVGGGFSTVASAYRHEVTGARLVDRYPVVENRPAPGALGWAAGILNRTDGDVLLFVHVTCASIPFGTQVVTGSGAADGRTPVTAACPAGTHVTAGGWSVRTPRSTSDVIVPLGSVPALAGQSAPKGGPDGWAVVAKPANGSSATDRPQVRSWAVCASTHVRSVATTGAGLAVPAGGPTEVTTAHVTARCPAGRVLTGAGVERRDAVSGLSLTQLAPDRLGDASAFGLTENSLPQVGIDSVDNLGGEARLVGVCVTRSLA